MQANRLVMATRRRPFLSVQYITLPGDPHSIHQIPGMSIEGRLTFQPHAEKTAESARRISKISYPGFSRPKSSGTFLRGLKGDSRNPTSETHSCLLGTVPSEATWGKWTGNNNVITKGGRRQGIDCSSAKRGNVRRRWGSYRSQVLWLQEQRAGQNGKRVGLWWPKLLPSKLRLNGFE